MKIRHLLLIFVFSLFASTTFAQDSNVDRYESEDGHVSFLYPRGWTVQVDGTFGTISNMPIAFDVANMEVGQQAIFFLALPTDELPGIPDDLPPDQLAQLMVMQLLTDTENEYTLSQPSIFTLESGIVAGRIDLHQATDRGAAIVYQQDDYLYAFFAIAHTDAFEALEPLVLQFIASFELSMDGLNGNLPLPDIKELLDENAPVRSVIVDLDMAHDDMIALLYLLNHPQINVQAITVTGTGEAHCEAGVRNALSLVELSGQDRIPVACGHEAPLVGHREFPAAWRADADAAYGVVLPQVEVASESSAIEVLSAVLSASDEPMTIITLGPLTNLGELLQTSPELTANIAAIYIMGGAMNVPGNVGSSGVGIDNSVAEWNIYIDPHAANTVLRSGIPVTLIPLDATQDVPMTTTLHTRLGDLKASPEANIVYEILAANLDEIDLGFLQFWDTATVSIVTDPSLATFDTQTIVVEENEGTEIGWTRVDDDGVSVRVATGVNRSQFETLFLTVINQVD